MSATTAFTQSVWFGTKANGIYHAAFNTKSGKLGPVTLAAEIKSPGFLALHPNQSLLYAVGALDKGPAVAAYQIANGELTFVNSETINDGGAAHLAVHPSGNFLITAQYGGGSTAVFPLDTEGKIQPRSQLHKHEGGSNVVPGRQSKPHAHWTGFDAEGNFAFVPDLGMDKVVIYKVVDRELGPHGFGVCPPGGGPRHMKFSPDGNLAYVLNELSLTVTSFAYDKEKGTLKSLGTVETLTAEEKADETFNSASEIRVHPSGKFVYSANRGHDSISVFEHTGGGRLTRIEVEPVRGAWPRNFNLDPSGKWLLAAGRDTDSVAVFAVDPDTGKLSYQRGGIAQVPGAICVLFSP